MGDDSGKETIHLHHWVYGVTPGVGYGTKAVSQNLNTSLYEAKLKGHLTPIRGEAVQGDGSVDMRLFHPVGQGEEVLLSLLGKGPRDEEGRPTFQNHTAIIPTKLLTTGRSSLFAVDRAVRDFDTKSPNLTGAIPPLEIPIDAEGTYKPGVGIRQHINRAAAETLASRRIADAYGRNLVLCRNSTPAARNEIMYKIIELLNLAAGVPFFTGASDATTGPTLNYFNLIVASRGVRADASWALIDAAMERPGMGRIGGREAVYQKIDQVFEAEAGAF